MFKLHVAPKSVFFADLTIGVKKIMVITNFLFVLFSFTENMGRTLQREDLLLLIENLETSSGILRAALEDVECSELPTPLSGSETRLHEEESWYSKVLHGCRRNDTLKKFLSWILRYHFIMTVIIQVIVTSSCSPTIPSIAGAKYIYQRHSLSDQNSSHTTKLSIFL